MVSSWIDEIRARWRELSMRDECTRIRRG